MNSGASAEMLAGQSRLGPRLVPGMLAASAFGPYLVESIRTEQALVYGLAVISLFRLGSLSRAITGLLVPWCLILGCGGIGLLGGQATLPWGPGNLVAGIDNYLLPVAVMIITGTLVVRETARSALIIVSTVVVWAAAANTLVAMAQSRGVGVALLRHFWGASSGDSVADSAATMGRFSGIFNQPAEAGAAYSLALVLAIWLYLRRPVLLALLGNAILVGGVLSVSKIFIFVGIPVAVWFLWRVGGLWMAAVNLAGLGTVLLALYSSGVGQAWEGWDYFTRLFRPAEGDWVTFYTAGRWDSDGTGLPVTVYILETSPLVGLGLSGLSAAYDSAWNEVLIVGGLLGDACLTVLLAVLAWSSLKNSGKEWRRLGLAVSAVCFGASFGIPVFTANRVATLVWVVICLVAIGREGGNHVRPRAVRRISSVAAETRRI